MSKIKKTENLVIFLIKPRIILLNITRLSKTRVVYDLSIRFISNILKKAATFRDIIPNILGL